MKLIKCWLIYFIIFKTRYYKIILFQNLHNKYIIFRFPIAFSWDSANNTRYIKMHLSALLFLIIMCTFAHSAIGITEIDFDSVYFPDQTDYIKLSTRCKDNMILWPGTRRCYKEGEQGPCNIGRVLTFNRRLLKPYCKDLIF